MTNQPEIKVEPYNNAFFIPCMWPVGMKRGDGTTARCGDAARHRITFEAGGVTALCSKHLPFLAPPSKPEEGSELMDAVREMDLLMEKDYSLGPDAMAKRMAWIKLKCRLAASAGEPCEPTPPGSVPVFGQDVSPEGITTAMGYRTEDGVTHFTSIETAKPTNPNPIPNPRERIWWSPSFDQCFIGPTIPGNAITYYPASRCIKAEDRVKELEGALRLTRGILLEAYYDKSITMLVDRQLGKAVKIIDLAIRGPQGEG